MSKTITMPLEEYNKDIEVIKKSNQDLGYDIAISNILMFLESGTGLEKYREEHPYKKIFKKYYEILKKEK